MENDVILKVEHLKQYFKMGRSVLKAVDDVSFEVKRGEVFGIVGESGCARQPQPLYNQAYDITGGDVWFKGQHILPARPT